MLQTVIVSLSPFVQLGSTYYYSIATLSAAIGLIAWWRPLGQGLARSGLAVLVVAFMSLSFFSSPTLGSGSDLLRVGREGIVFVFLIAALIGFQRRGAVIARPPYALLLVLAGGYFLLAVVQAYYLPQGIYMGLPQLWFATDAQTLANDLDLTYNQALRPTGTFSEPSYLGFMMVSVALMVVPVIGRDRVALATLALAIVTGLTSRSLAFFLSAILVVALPFALERGRDRLAIVGMLLLVSLPVIAFSGESVLSRLSVTGYSNTIDLSTSDRIFGPLAALPRYLLAYPLGNPFGVVAQSLIPFLSRQTADPADILNNALFNLLFSYGVVGIVIIAMMLFYARDLRIRLYLLTAAMFNGAFLAVDKIPVICLTLAIYEYGVQYAGRKRAVEVSDPRPAGWSELGAVPRG